MNQARIDEIKELCEKATEGPWAVGWACPLTGPDMAALDFDLLFADWARKNQPPETYGMVCCPSLERPVVRSAPGRQADDQFIAASRTIIPELVEEVERQAATIDARDKRIAELERKLKPKRGHQCEEYYDD